MTHADLYVGREQTFVKHFILEKYLERFAYIVGSRWTSVTYVDCFSGPWNARSDRLADSSFSIALHQLRKAQRLHALRGRAIELRCFFLEKDRVAYRRLRRFADDVHDATVETRNAALEESVDDIIAFVRAGGSATFPFILIDPTGWSGFELRTIAPLLQLDPCEVLINFMTGHIRRFLTSPQEETLDSFERLFGSRDFQQRIQGTAERDRGEVAVDEYARSIRRVGRYPFSCSAIVLHPELSRTHFHLIYATRNTKGIEVFKEAEKKAMSIQEAARAAVAQRKRVKKSGQLDLLDEQTLHDKTHYYGLRERYLEKMRSTVLEALAEWGQLLYDEAWNLVLPSPLTWESDLKHWLTSEERIDLRGLAPRQRVPQLGKNNLLVWKEGSTP